MVLENRIIDTSLEMEDGAAAITASGAGSAIIDLGSSTAKCNFDIELFVSACEVDTTDEEYTISLELSSSATFASTIVDPVNFMLGTNGVSANADVFGTTGRFVIRASNEYGGTLYRYARLYVTVAGTIVTGITFKAWMSKRGD